MTVHSIHRWRRLLLVACSLGGALPGAAIAKPVESDGAPALLSSRLQAAATPLQDGRYLLRPRLVPVQSTRDVTGEVVLRTVLTPKGVAICGADVIFSDGFESP